MKHAVAVLVIALSAASAARSAQFCPPERESPVEKLKKISGRMCLARDRLQADHHGVQVQVPQREIVRELDRLIERLRRAQEEREGPPGPETDDPGTGPRLPRTGPRTDGPPRGGTNTSKPLDGEKVTSGAIMHGIKALIGSRGGKWGDMPHKPRLRILQAYTARMPERYRKMMVIYWAALAEEGLR